MNNILVTGGAGYIGSHVCESLIKNKKKVFIVDNLSSGSKKLINKKVVWISKINQIKKNPSIFIANEFFDVIAIRQFKKKGTFWFEKFVNLEKKNKPFFYLIHPFFYLQNSHFLC